MARAGINKVHVLQARDALLAKGVNPSIDALRTELGNTGSRSTIHRYLREIEDERGVRLDDEALLSVTLKELVGRLAIQLRDEAQAIVSEAAVKHDAAAALWTTRESTLKAQLQAAEENQQASKVALDQTRASLDEANSQLQQERVQAQRLIQHNADLQERLAENEKHRQSLEEKHQHARESLDHYRQSVKEQREQDQRRHEEQVQQLQSELRRTNEALMVKQHDITQLNNDNARLSSEIGAAQKHLSLVQTDYRVAQDAIGTWRDKATQLETQLGAAVQRQQELQNDLDDFKRQLQEKVDQYQHSTVSIVKAEMLLTAQEKTILDLQARLQNTSLAQHPDERSSPAHNG